MKASARKVRIAILGGGCAGVAAAFRLSRTQALRDRFDITIYQQGFRLGGKGATGRDSAGNFRIEEHGLHVWLGWYERAFSMMRECFEELNLRGHAHRIEDEFSPHYKLSLCADHLTAGEPEIWHLLLPPRPGVPWQPSAPRAWFEYSGALSHWATESAWAEVLGALRLPRGAWRRQARILVALTQTILRGLAHDVLPYGFERGIARIDEFDLCEWLVRHGAASPDVHDAPPIRAIYDLAFAYPDGISGRGRGRVAAGAALNALLRILFAYRGAPFWRMNAGMGDTVFSPLHDLLIARGVNISFFHRATALRLDSSRLRVERVELSQQARTLGQYDPLIRVGNRRCWPNAPRWELLEGGKALADANVDFESSRSGLSERNLTLRARDDFDAVVLAIPVSALRPLVGDLIGASTPFAAMIETAHSVATWSMQLWLRPTLSELGWRAGSTIMTSFAHPFGSWADMTETARSELWPDDNRPGAVVYFCDVAPQPEDSDPVAVARQTRDAARRFCSGPLCRLWPGMSGLARGDESMFLGDAGFAGQYVRANVEPSERYVLSLPGTTKHRLAPERSGFENLFLAGDWTKTSINGGSVEAAVESGFRAADAIAAQHP